MKQKRILTYIVLITLCSVAILAQTTEMTYQGKLQSSAAAANGNFDFEFLLFNGTGGGAGQIGPTITRNNVPVSDGIFSVNLDFGPNFPGATRFLEIRVRQSGGGAFTTLSPRQPVTSAPYSIKSSTSDNATNATNFTGPLAGDVVGTQGATSVVRLQNRNVASTQPLDGQVLKYNGAASQWVPGTDNGGTGGGGTITGVTAGTGLTGGGSTGNVTLGIANGGVATTQLADSAVTSPKIAGGQVVKTLNSLTDNVTLAAGANISITPSGNTLTIASTGGGGGVSGSGTAGQVPVWTGASTLGVSQITQSGGNIGVGLTSAPLTDRLTVQTATDNYGVVHTNGSIAVGSYVGGSTGGGWYGTRSNHPLSFFTNNSSPRLTIGTDGSVGIGTTTTFARLEVSGSGLSGGVGIQAQVQNTTIGIRGLADNGTGVAGQAVTGTGVSGTSQGRVGVRATNVGTGGAALRADGSSWFAGNTTPFTVANVGTETGIAIGSVSGAGFIYSYEHGVNAARTLAINTPGGNVGIGTFNPDQTLTVNGNASKVGGGSWLAFSDERLKNIKGRFNGGLKAVMKLQPLRYEYKKDNLADVKSDGQHIGFSAQEVEKVIPEAVTKTDQGIRMVNNDPILWTMLNAIKEQQAEIERLSAQVRRMQRRMNVRKNRR